jgi:multiple sugar transport system permease protein
MLLAALQSEPGDMYEAADIDGATYLQKLFRITIPSIRNTNLVTLLCA